MCVCPEPTGRGGFLWPGLNTPVVKDGTLQSMSRRGESEQQEMQAELGTEAGCTERIQTHFSFWTY